MAAAPERAQHRGEASMSVVFVAASKTLAEWGEGVGLTKHLYALRVADEDADASVEEMNTAAFAGQTDWKLLKKQEVDSADADALIARLVAREKMVDPKFYPRIKGARGIFKVKPENIENSIMVKRALEQQEMKVVKLKPADIGAYLIRNAVE
jgi:hypothetical protein